MTFAFSRWLTSFRAGDRNSSEVSVPIGPAAGTTGVTFQTSWGYFDLPRHGVEFAADLVTSIYQIWLHPDNEPVTKIVGNRMIPFFHWEARVTPRFFPRTPQLLTPQKIGIATFAVLKEVIQLDQWPGYAKVKIFQGQPLPSPQTNQIGSVEFHNKPNHEDLGSASNVTALGDIRYTQRWLMCFTKAMFLALPKRPNDLVTADRRFTPKPAVSKHGIQCRDSGWADRIDFFIYPTANPGSSLALVWKEFLFAMQDWLVRIAQGKDPGKSVKIIKEGNKLVAEISIYIQGVPASEQPDVATS